MGKIYINTSNYEKRRGLLKQATAVLLLSIFTLTASFPGGAFIYAQNQPAVYQADIADQEVLEIPLDAEVKLDAPLDAVIEPKTEVEPLEAQVMAQVADGQDTYVPRLEAKEESKSGKVSVDSSNGALTYVYKIATPPGRNGIEPNLSLEYNSAQVSEQSVWSAGWALNIPSIKRLNKEGANKLYTSDYYYSSVSGELVSVGTDVFRPKVETGDFLTYKKINNGWIVSDKSGVQYKFGSTAASRQDDQSDNSRIYEWMLDEVRDQNSNFATYAYYKDEGQIYPSEINYTGNGVSPGIFKVIFTRTIRSDHPVSYASGFKVRTNFQISEIRTEVNGNWARKYTLSFGPEDSGSGLVLDTILESGRSNQGVIAALPPTHFDYQKSTAGWQYSSAMRVPEILSYINESTEIGLRLGDLNGDGLTDIICRNDKTNFICGRSNPALVYLNNGDGTWMQGGFGLPGRIDDPDKTESFANELGASTGLTIVDVNGDGFNDLARSSGTQSYVYLNDGASLRYDPSWILPSILKNLSRNADSGVRLADINGDGLVDILCHTAASLGDCNQNNKKIYLNTGSGWEESPWNFPLKVDDQNRTETFADSNGKGTGLILIDLNNDGLPDLVRGSGASNGISYAYLNTGSSWIYEPAIRLPYTLLYLEQTADNGLRLADVNGDKLVDVLCHNSQDNGPCGISNAKIHVNKGDGEWGDAQSSSFPTSADNADQTEIFATESKRPTSLTIFDINGDGQDDLLRGINGSNGFVYLNNTKSAPNLLSKITYPEGGMSQVSYKSSMEFRDSNGGMLNPKLPSMPQIVSDIATYDGQGHTNTVRYEYEGGKNYFENHVEERYAGFAVVKQISSNGSVVKTYYHQGDTTNSALGEYNDSRAKIGRSFRTETYDAGGLLQSVEMTKWEQASIAPKSDFVYPTSTLTRIFDGSISRDTAVSSTFDATNGNLLQKKEWGDVLGSNNGNWSDIGFDRFVTDYAYAENSNSNSSIYKPSKVTVTNQNNIKEKEPLYYYDNLSFGQLSKGQNTKEEVWISGPTYAAVSKMYNQFGLVASMSDPRGKPTSFVYDSYNLFPVTVTNPLSMRKAFIYDYTNGKPLSETNENNSNTSWSYDGFGRIKELRVQSDSDTNPSVNTTFAYLDVPNNSFMMTSRFLTSSPIESYKYLDGLGRPIQEKTRSAAGYVTTDTIYNNDGNVAKVSLPYITSSPTRSSPTANLVFYTEFTYDFAGRVIKAKDALGETAHTYKLLDETIVDALGHKKTYSKNAFGQLIKVTEYIGTTPYYTTYQYNYGGNLLQITDALGNIRRFEYDGRGLITRSEDLYAPKDLTYGVHSYTYDLAGNMISHQTPTANVLYVYNDLNQMISENDPSTFGTDFIYEYNNCLQGNLRLCKAIGVNGVTTSYAYTREGFVKSEAKTIDGQTFNESFMYDKQGNVLSIAYPDHSIVAYIYDAGGRISSITRKANNSSPSVAVINTVTYAPHGQIATMNFANGLTQIHTYNQNKNYQLINKRAGVFQNIIYGYDALGNILTLTDNSITSTKKTATYTYDDLNRLKTASISNVASGQAPYAETYTYNPVGNILSKTGINYSYSGLNYTNPHAPTSIGASTLIYDNSGNLLSDGVKGNIWNYKNQLSSSSIDRNVYYYFYDHTGERMKEMAPKSTTYTPFNNYVSSAAKKTKNIYLGSILVATVDNTVESASSTVSYILTDHLGSTEKVTNQAGQLVETYDYLPFGKERITSNQSKRRYIGEIYDSTTGYNYLNARYYDSSRGQFISQDSMFWEIGKTGNPENVLRDPQQMNSYSYASNNPIMHSDPTGRCVDGISTIACIVAWSAISSIVAGHGLILYGAITENTQAIEGGFALNEIGTAGGGGLVYTQTQANNLNNKIETSVPSVTIKKSGEVIKTTSNIPDEALVVRGGGLTNQTPVKFNITESRIPGITGFSVQCKVSCVNIEQLNQLGRYLRNNELSVTTAKTIRQNGGNIVITPGLGEHATVTNLDGNQASQIPWKGFTNPKK